MDRRLAMRAMIGGGAVAVAGRPTFASPRRLCAAPVVRLDVRSGTSWVTYPSEVVRAALPKLVACPLTHYGYDGPVVGTAADWRIAGGWLVADLYAPADLIARVSRGELVARGSTMGGAEWADWEWVPDAAKEGGGEWKAASRLVSIQVIEKVALLNPVEAAWTVSTAGGRREG